MIPFLKQVATHYYAQGQLERKCFVFPNRRAILFFKKYLGEMVAVDGVPVVSPQMFTMNDFFYRITGKNPSSREQLILKLYECYRRLDKREEELDEFIFWGGVLLSDFNDVDKYLVDADMLFSNVSDFKSMQSPEEYLDREQLAALERFLGHFKTGGSYKAEFLRIWEILRPLYRDFNDTLSRDGLSYEGQVYRELAERLAEQSVADVLAPVFEDVEGYVFVGLNALNACERRLMSRMRDACIAEFCWDYSSDMIRDPHNKSSFFMARNVSEYPQAIRLDPDGLVTPEVNVISVPSAVGQAKQIPEILSRIGGGIDIRTAVVLPDEGLLLPVLNSIPEDVRDINVTMGYPMNGSALWSLMNEISSLQMHLRIKDTKAYFYHRQVWGIFSNSIFRNIVSDAGKEIVERVKKSAGYYVAEDDLHGDPLMELIFRPVVTDPTVRDPEVIRSLCRYGRELLAGIAPKLKDKEDMALELDFAREYYLAIGRLSTQELKIRPSTYFRMLSQLVGAAAVPFKGEPLHGLQIMGPLETRALDFDNIILLGCNEGVFPRRSVSPSFIPPELRKGFDLPTYEYQDAVWAYYFYRMIQRCRNLWLLFDSRTEISRSGEPSRYISQLELHFGVKTNRYVVKSPIIRKAVDGPIPKTEDIVALIRGKELSASAIQTYQACPVKFYYHTVCGLEEKEEVTESLDAGMFGTIYHETMQSLYASAQGTVTRTYLKSLLSDGDAVIKNGVRSRIMEKLHSFEVTGRNLIYEDIICRYVRKTLQRDMELMDSYAVDSFKILGLELRKTARLCGFKFKGYIDRLDSFVPDEIRVVDYKTGKVDRDKVDLQLFLYDAFLKGDTVAGGKRIVNSVYQLSRLFVDGVENEEMDSGRREEMEGKLEAVLSEMSDTSVPFTRTDDVDGVCAYCDFKIICGR